MRIRYMTASLGLLLLGVLTPVLAVYDWSWNPFADVLVTNDGVLLTDCNGSRASAAYYVGGTMYAVAGYQDDYDYIHAAVYIDGGNPNPRAPEPESLGYNPCVAISPDVAGAPYSQKHILWCSPEGVAHYCDAGLDYDDDNWSHQALLDDGLIYDGQSGCALAIGTGWDGKNTRYVYACYRAHPTSGNRSDGVWFRVSYNMGVSWQPPPAQPLSQDPADEIALASDPLGTHVYVAYHYMEGSTHKIALWYSYNGGTDWSKVAGSPWSDVAQPSIAVLDEHVVVCWVQAPSGGNPTEGGKVVTYWSADDFTTPHGPHTVDSYSDAPWMIYNAPSIHLVKDRGTGQDMWNLVVVSELYDDNDASNWLSTTSGRFYSGDINWSPYCEHYMPSEDGEACENANPCAVTCDTGAAPVVASCFWVDDGDNGYLWRTNAAFVQVPPWIPFRPVWCDGPGRRIWPGPNGTVNYAARVGANVHSGQAYGDGWLQPVLVSGGGLPALAVDGAGKRWVAFRRGDTLLCMQGNGRYRAVFAGSSSAIPGQPSIVCYPNQANGVYVANVVFPVYDTLGNGQSSIIYYARVDTSHVVLDTIESVANLRDSLPSVSVFKTDSILVTWQHGTDSVLSSMLPDYGPGTSGQPPAWSSPSLVAASGYHPMSVMDGSVLNCDWTGHSGSNYSIQRATNDLGGGMFGGWTAQTPPSASSDVDKANSVYAGVGCSVWQQENLSGKWVIKGFVRGAETTLVANDTDAYHPHAMAESNAISPSVNRIALHLLYDAGVAFEVDSGVYDTGQVRYSCFDFDVSHAGSNATKYNNGSKLIRQGDSLFSVYGDLDGSVVYAWSATGDSWQRNIMVTSRDNPAIAEDSTGRRWIVVHKAAFGMSNAAEEAYYRSGSSWGGPQTIYTAGTGGTIGPASLAGVSSVSDHIAYAAFLVTSGVTKSVILAKFNGGTSLSTYTVATGAGLGDPCVAVEPYKSDSDHVHVTWEDNGTIKYCMDTDGRGTGIASKWTATYALTGVGVVGHHPSIGADRSRIVVAWAQGTTADIYSRKRATSNAYNNWESALNLSNTANNASDYPTIAMGDTVVVAWEETRTANDHDILACIEFGDTINIADNPTISSYPHVVFQNKTSGDTLIPYLHTIWSETPEVSYYEVRYNKLNLKHPTGGGQQAAGLTPIPIKPSLAACRPNPFRDRTQISYALPTAGNVSLRVYDVTGRTVRMLASGFQRAGSYSVSWDSRDSRGRQVPRGVYFYRLDAPGFRSVKKAVVAR